jgi:cell division protease FtsH
MAKNLLLWLVIAAVLLSIFNNFSMQSPTERMVYSEFIQEIQRDQVRKVTIDGLTIYGRALDGSRFETTRPWSRIPS